MAYAPVRGLLPQVSMLAFLPREFWRSFKYSFMSLWSGTYVGLVRVTQLAKGQFNLAKAPQDLGSPAWNLLCLDGVVLCPQQLQPRGAAPHPEVPSVQAGFFLATQPCSDGFPWSGAVVRLNHRQFCIGGCLSPSGRGPRMLLTTLLKGQPRGGGRNLP